MIPRKRILISSLLLLAMISAGTIAQAARTPTLTTIPPVQITSKGVLFECSPSIIFPGSVNQATAGFLRVKCPTGGYVQLGINGNLSLIPTFTLPSGYLNASIIVSQSAGSPCNFNFKQLVTGNTTFPSGAILTSGNPIAFSSPVIQGQMQAGLYDYCLQYDSSQATSQINGFTVSWT